MDFYYLMLYFFVYGFLGWCTEVAFAAVKEQKFVNRGFLNGPICPIYGVGVSAVVFFLEPYSHKLLLLYVASVIIVTLIEGLTGWIMDVLFHSKWWDYSDMKFNIGGYVCLTFSLIWGVACVAIMKFIHPLIHKVLTFIPHTLGVIIIVILAAALIADLSVTVSAILKFNKHLEKMEKIAKELHEISDQIGDDISEKVFAALEKGNNSALELREFKMEKEEERLYRIAELKERYNNIVEKIPYNTFRLEKAFPKMQSRIHEKQFDSFRRIKDDLRNERKKLKALRKEFENNLKNNQHK